MRGASAKVQITMAIQSCGGEGGGPNHDGNPLISNCFSKGKKRGVRGGGSECEGPKSRWQSRVVGARAEVQITMVIH